MERTLVSNRLLEQQQTLLEYLTSGSAIFCDPAEYAPLQGFDGDLLRLEARFSYEKRIEKIAGIMPKTTALIKGYAPAAMQAFVAAFPPVNIGRLENARQFVDFLRERCEADTDLPGFLPDIAACEVACAQVRNGPIRTRTDATAPVRNAFRRDPNAVLVLCRYDIRAFLEGAALEDSPPLRDTPLVIAVERGAAQLQILELAPAAYEWLSTLGDWDDAASLALTPALHAVIEDFATRGLVEIHP
jgi:hypothetical protein